MKIVWMDQGQTVKLETPNTSVAKVSRGTNPKITSGTTSHDFDGTTGTNKIFHTCIAWQIKRQGRNHLNSNGPNHPLEIDGHDWIKSNIYVLGFKEQKGGKKEKKEKEKREDMR